LEYCKLSAALFFLAPVWLPKEVMFCRFKILPKLREQNFPFLLQDGIPFFASFFDFIFCEEFVKECGIKKNDYVF